MNKIVAARVAVVLTAVSLLGASAAAQDDSSASDEQKAPAGSPPSPVRAVEVVKKDVAEYRKVTGDLRVRARSKVATIEPGLVIELPVREGDVVKKGDVLARLDDRRLVIELRNVEAQIAAAEATLAERAADLKRYQRDFELLTELAQRNAGNPKELNDAESDVNVAMARKEQAERNISVLRAQADLFATRLSDMLITAPFDGVIVSRDTEVGQWAGQGQAMVEVVSTGAFEAWLDVSEQFAQAVLGAGVKVPVEILALRKRLDPATPRVIRQVDKAARSLTVIVPVADEYDNLSPGMSVIGWIPSGRRGEHLIVPRDALLMSQAGFFVFSVVPGVEGPASAAPVQIEVAFEYENSVAVRPGSLRPGDLVVVEGNERLLLSPNPTIEVLKDGGTGATDRAGGGDDVNVPVEGE